MLRNIRQHIVQGIIQVYPRVYLNSEYAPEYDTLFIYELVSLTTLGWAGVASSFVQYAGGAAARSAQRMLNHDP